jgi:hypothetical protein
MCHRNIRQDVHVLTIRRLEVYWKLFRYADVDDGVSLPRKRAISSHYYPEEATISQWPQHQPHLWELFEMEILDLVLDRLVLERQ